MPMIPGTYEHGALWWVGDILGSVSTVFSYVATQAYKIVVVGDFLGDYFSTISTWFYWASYNLHNADYWAWQSTRAVQNLFYEWGANNLLTELVWFWDWFRTRPGDFIRACLASILAIPQPYDAYPDTWLNYLLVRLWGEWWSFIMDPGGFILGKIKNWNLAVWWWITSPLDALKANAGMLLGIPEGLRYDMRLWPRHILIGLWSDYEAFTQYWGLWFISKIEIYLPHAALLLRSPVIWFVTMMYENYQVPAYVWISFPDNMILWGIDELEERRDKYFVRLRDFLCSFIRYMLEGIWRP